MELPDHRKSDGACCRAWPGYLDSAASGAPKNCPDRTSVHDCPCPVDNFPATAQPVQQNEGGRLPDTTLLPVTQSSQQLIPEPQPISCGSISPGIPLHRTNTT